MWATQENIDGAARNSLANERTFLSWFRTAVTLLALGAAIVRFNLVKRSLASGIILLVMGIVMMYLGLLRYFQVQRKLQRMEFQPNRIGVWLVVAGTFAVGAALIVLNAVP